MTRMATAERFHVLTIDDDAAIRRQLRGVLEDEGHAVSFEHGPEILATLAATSERS